MDSPRTSKELDALKAARDHLNQLAFGGFNGEGVIPRHYKRTWETTVNVISQLQSAIDGATAEPRVAERLDETYARIVQSRAPRRRPTLEESNAWSSAEEERDWWRNYALQIEGSAQPPAVGRGEPSGCSCQYVEGSNPPARHDDGCPALTKGNAP